MKPVHTQSFPPGEFDGSLWWYGRNSVTPDGNQGAVRLYLPHTNSATITCVGAELPKASDLTPVTTTLNPFLRGLPLLTDVLVDAPQGSLVYCKLDRLADAHATELVTFRSVERPGRGLVVLLETGDRVQYCPATGTTKRHGWSLVDWKGRDLANEPSAETGPRLVPWVAPLRIEGVV